MRVYAKIFIVLMVVGVIALGVVHFFEEQFLRVQSIELNLDKLSDEEVIFSRVRTSLDEKLKKHMGQWIWRLSLSQVLDEALADQRIEAASVRRIFPNKIRMTVRPHSPVVLLLAESGEFFPVAMDASLLPATPTMEVPNVPVLRGVELLKNHKLRQQAIAMYLEVPNEGLFNKKNISEILYKDAEGFEFRMTNSGLKLLVGESLLGPKSGRIEQVMKYLESQQIKGRVIDARFSKKVVVRLRNEP